MLKYLLKIVLILSIFSTFICASESDSGELTSLNQRKFATSRNASPVDIYYIPAVWDQFWVTRNLRTTSDYFVNCQLSNRKGIPNLLQLVDNLMPSREIRKIIRSYNRDPEIIALRSNQRSAAFQKKFQAILKSKEFNSLADYSCKKLNINIYRQSNALRLLEALVSSAETNVANEPKSEVKPQIKTKRNVLERAAVVDSLKEIKSILERVAESKVPEPMLDFKTESKAEKDREGKTDILLELARDPVLMADLKPTSKSESLLESEPDSETKVESSPESESGSKSQSNHESSSKAQPESQSESEVKTKHKSIPVTISDLGPEMKKEPTTKPDPKSESKPESNSDISSEKGPKSEQIYESQNSAEPNSETKPQVKPEIISTKPDGRPESKLDIETDLNIKPLTDTNTAEKIEVTLDTVNDPKPGYEPQISPGVNIETILAAKPVTQTQIKPEHKPGSNPESEADNIPMQKPESNQPEQKPVSQVETENGTIQKPELNLETKPVIKPVSNEDTKPENKPETKPESKPQIKPDSKPTKKPQAPNKPKGIKGLLQSLEAILPQEKLKILYDHTLKSDKELQKAMENFKSTEFKELFTNVQFKIPEYKQLKEDLIKLGAPMNELQGKIAPTLYEMRTLIPIS